MRHVRRSHSCRQRVSPRPATRRRRQAQHGWQKPVEQRSLLGGVFDLVVPEGQLADQHRCGVQREISAFEVDDAPNQQTGRREQQYGERDLPHDQKLGSEPRARARPCVAHAAEHAAELDARHDDGRRETERQERRPRDDPGAKQRRRVEPDLAKARERSPVRSCVKTFKAMAATTTPSAPPTTAMTACSVSSWAATRARPAPSASRTANSSYRESPRTSSRFATLMHVIDINSAQATTKAIMAGLASPRTRCASGVTTPRRLRMDSGASGRRKYALSSSRAANAEASLASRPIRCT